MRTYPGKSQTITACEVGYACAMVDASLVRLLRECDNYLSRQRSLLDLAVAANCDNGVVTAMDAALDQLTGAVVDGWRIFRAEMVSNLEDVDEPDCRPEPGE
jgi:hypothetical protein